MHPLLRKLERIVDDLIWPALIVLLVIIIVELGFPHLADKWESLIHVADNSIILLFTVDLAFKWYRTRKLKKFLRKYWLDILAVFPFFLLFRTIEGIRALLGNSLEIGERTQRVLHGGIELEKEGAQIIREIETGVKETSRAQRASRSTRFARFIRPLFRLPRFAKAAHFYEKPK
ncbi:hypothetical protein D6774_00920 [Candidatus Woesearchaeota archaeon]|nr:MAG: hypothetical protein D6774_00920 [Candidatus Woesearchaeota archaeon]